MSKLILATFFTLLGTVNLYMGIKKKKEYEKKRRTDLLTYIGFHHRCFLISINILLGFGIGYVIETMLK